MMRNINSWCKAPIHAAKPQFTMLCINSWREAPVLFCHKVMVLDGQLTDAVKEVDNSLLCGNHNTHEVHLGAELDFKELVAVIGKALYHGAVHIIYLKGLVTTFLGSEGMNEALVHIPVDEGVHDFVTGENADHLAGLDGAHHFLTLFLKRAYADIVLMTGLGLVRLGSGGLLLFLLCSGNGEPLLSFGRT